MTDEEALQLMQQYLDDANAENAAGTHRGVVLVWASIVDSLLSKMLKAHLVPLNGEQSDHLFGQNGPLGSFSSRTKMLHALGIIQRDEMTAIDLMRKIRNDFAHQVGLTLNDPPFAQQCRQFKERMTGESGGGDPKLMFIFGCGPLVMLLVNRLRRIERTQGMPDNRPLPDRAFWPPEQSPQSQ